MAERVELMLVRGWLGFPHHDAGYGLDAVAIAPFPHLGEEGADSQKFFGSFFQKRTAFFLISPG
jgi:hypothetical protein